MELKEICKSAHEDRILVGTLTSEIKNKVLMDAAEALQKQEAEILSANALDVENARRNQMSKGLIDRLVLNHERIEGMADGLKQIAALEDPIGDTMEEFHRPNGLLIRKKRVPIGVVGIIYEARPNVTSDAFGLCFKTGNCSILKGGSDAIHSNIAIVVLVGTALETIFTPRNKFDFEQIIFILENSFLYVYI